MRSFLPFFAVTGCVEPQLQAFDNPPQVAIVAPEQGDLFEPGTAVELVGVATDQGGPDALEISWSSSLDGLLGGKPPDVEGNVYLAVSQLTAGEHAITLEAVDRAGNSASTSVGIRIGEGGFTTPGLDDPEAPSAVLDAPADLSTFLREELVGFSATVSDPQQPPETLSGSLTSDLDGTLWEGNPSIAGNLTIQTTSLAVGVHTVTLSVVDDDGNVGTDTVKLEILNDGRPFAVIDAPSTGTTAFLGDLVVFEGTVWDLEDDAIELQVEWASDVDGVLKTGFADSNGYTAFSTAGLLPGTHVVTLTAFDTDAKNAADTILLELVDPDELDEDEDGFTPNDGDCDDAEFAANPGEAEVCDAIDNDCDGVVNNGFEDAYELPTNDLHADASWLGEIDNEALGYEIVNLSGLTLQDPLDEDWFEWDADDDWYDNVDITVTATLPSTGHWVVELYWNDGGTLVLRDSASGSGTLIVSAKGSTNLFDEDEDVWAIRVLPSPGAWDAEACLGDYTLEIRS